MLLRTKLHGKTYEFLETGGFDTSFATKAQDYSTIDVANGLEASFIFPSSHFVSFVSFVVKK